MPISYIESFIFRQLPNLPSHIIIQICTYLDHAYIIDFFLYLQSPVRGIIIHHYFSKSIHLAIRRPLHARSVERLQTQVSIHRFPAIEKFLDDHPDVNPHQVTIITRGDFRSFESLIKQYQQRLSEQCDKICFELESFELSIDGLKVITTCLPNVHKLQLANIGSLKCLNDLKQVGFSKMTNLEELNISAHGVNWSSVKLPWKLRHLEISCRETDVTTIIVPPSVEYLCYDECNINNDKLSRLNFPPQLKTLKLTKNNIRDVSLNRFPRTLETLNLSLNGITNLSVHHQNEMKQMIRFPRLVTIVLSSNNIDNITLDWLSNMRWPESLRKLSLDDNRITSLRHLYNLPDTLDTLNISKNQISTLVVEEFNPREMTSFQFPRFLSTLDLSHSRYNFELIKKHSKRIKFPDTLSTLDLSFCNIHDLSLFHFPSGLKNLILLRNRISDLICYNNGNEISWQNLIQLTNLDLTFNRITDLSSWFLPPKIQNLVLSENRLTVLTPEIPMFNAKINHLYTNLHQLDLSPNPIKQIGPRVTIPPGIKRLNLRLPLLKKFHITSGLLNSHIHELDLSRAHISLMYFIDMAAVNSNSSKLSVDSNILLNYQDDKVSGFYDLLEDSVGKKVRSRNSNINSKHFFL